MSFNLEPLPGFLVVERLDDAPDPSGIQVAETHREKPQRGRVLAVWNTDGNFNEDDPVLRLSVDDEILFRKFGPAEVELDGVKLLLLEQADVYAIIHSQSA